MSLIARFVFDKGDPVDVRLTPDQKEGFLDAVTNGKVFYDHEGGGVFFVNLAHARFFYISKETVSPTAGVATTPETSETATTPETSETATFQGPRDAPL